MKTIAAFDFDGTIIRRDSLPDFLLRTFGKGAFLLRLPLIVGMKVAALSGILSSHKAKEKVIASFVQGMREGDFQAACRAYARHIPCLAYPAALREIQTHQEAGHEVIIITASVPDWIRPWAEATGILAIEGTELERKDGILTGRFSNINCKGEEKVCRMRNRYPDLHYILYAYGDSTSDRALLDMADYSFYKPFRKE